jgi:glycosyltransferase involved in cell wall biosynthesis
MGFSIIICTYNPRGETFSRLLEALRNLDDLSPEHEVIIVDNNSTIPLSENQAARAFLAAQHNSSLIRETTPGLTAARLAGIRQAHHEWLVFFDDDNEPEHDYLIIAASAIDQHPQVGAWGPGVINVVYTQTHNSWLATKKTLFQEHNAVETVFAKEQSWQTCYPVGTGLIVNKRIADVYAERVNSGRYSLTDRRGKSLTSGGDAQLVFTAVEMDYSAGSIAGLKLNHLIDSAKAKFSYLRKQQYGTASAYVKAHNEVFRQNRLGPGVVTNYVILKTLYSLYRIHRSRLGWRDFELLVASKLGEIHAAVFAADECKPVLLKWYEKMIDV